MTLQHWLSLTNIRKAKESEDTDKSGHDSFDTEINLVALQ